MAPPRKTRCKRGHLFTEKNTKLTKLRSGYTVRQCKACRREFDKRRWLLITKPKKKGAVMSTIAGTTENAFKRFVASLFVQKNTGVDGLMHAAAGYAGEAGEVLDLIKKIWANGRPLDAATKAKLVEEIGDTMFYQQALLTLLGVDPNVVRSLNVEKLQKRYPSGYSDAAALARRDKADAEEKAA